MRQIRSIMAVAFSMMMATSTYAVTVKQCPNIHFITKQGLSRMINANILGKNVWLGLKQSKYDTNEMWLFTFNEYNGNTVKDEKIAMKNALRQLPLLKNSQAPRKVDNKYACVYSAKDLTAIAITPLPMMLRFFNLFA